MTTVPAAQYMGVEAFNPTTLILPPVPLPSILTTIPVQLQNGRTPGLSIMQLGSFLGFSIEMSMLNQVLGKNSTLIQVPFLNLMVTIQQCAGLVMIRVSGNTQESAKLVDSLPGNRIIQKNLSAPFNLSIVKVSQDILGNFLLGLQVGNEPDMYVLHKHRGQDNKMYGLYDYARGDPTGMGHAKNILVVPNIADFAWTPKDIWNMGFVDTYHKNLAYLAVEKYPNSNCGLMVHDSEVIIDPQTIFPSYLTHEVQPFTVPPMNQPTFHKWSVGPLYHSTLVMAEAIGPSNLTQVLDLNITGSSQYTPIYGIYENRDPVRIAVFNYVDDLSNVTAVISVTGAILAQVKVKYLVATSISQKGSYTWAGQTFSGFFESDGHLMGTEDIQTMQCNMDTQTYSIKVPTPGFALVFLTDAAFTENVEALNATFPMTAQTQTHNTGEATVNPSVLSTSNRHGAALDGLGSTSRGRNSAGSAVWP
ncbi:hypothetical protein B0H10DRAFT_2221571 [Mycena sp. CBHHK59/15]|nr:hypothetical protein B0H10DRAFT_2221571 [Mycena sp. CBHHK59/15]